MTKLLFIAIILTSISLIGCGPLPGIMPPRLNAEGQKKIDDAWDKALTPVHRLDNQTLLDAMMIYQAYQVGVDRLNFVSEKRCSRGVVIMEIRFDRSRPTDDRFSVRLEDPAGHILRQEVYGREQIERTYQELFVDAERLRKLKESGKLNSRDAAEWKSINKRMKRLKGVFPGDLQEAFLSQTATTAPSGRP